MLGEVRCIKHECTYIKYSIIPPTPPALVEFVGLMVEMLKLDGLECVLSQLSPTVLSDDGQESPPVEWIYRWVAVQPKLASEANQELGFEPSPSCLQRNHLGYTYLCTISFKKNCPVFSSSSSNSSEFFGTSLLRKMGHDKSTTLHDLKWVVWHGSQPT